MDHVEAAAAAEVDTAAVTVVTEAAVTVVTAVVVMAVTAVVVMAVTEAAVTVVTAVVVMAVEATLNPLQLMLINRLEQKAGKIEVTQILPKIQSLKMLEVEEKEVLQVIHKYLKKEIKTQLFEVLKFVLSSNQYLILL